MHPADERTIDNIKRMLKLAPVDDVRAFVIADGLPSDAVQHFDMLLELAQQPTVRIH